MEKQEQRISKELKNRPRTPDNEPFCFEIEKLAERVKERGGYEILEVGYNCSQ